MSRHQGVRWLFACALTLIAPLAFGQTGQQQMERTHEQMQQGSMMKGVATEHAQLARATAVIGHDVVDAKGEKIGTIKDVVLNEQGDRILYSAFSGGGVAGVGDKLFAVPWSDFRITPTSLQQVGRAQPQPQQGIQPAEQEGKQGMAGLWGDGNQKFQITLNITKDQLEQATSFNDDNWPTQANANLQVQGARQPMNEQQQTQQPSQNIWRLSKLFGQDVQSQTPLQGLRSEEPQEGTGSKIGELQDAALAISTGRPVYGQVTLANIEGRENAHTLVPWSALNFRETQEDQVQVALNVPSAQTLQQFAFQSGEFPAVTNRQYAERIYTAYNQEPDFEMLGFISPEHGAMPQRQMKESQQQHEQQQSERNY